MNNSSDKINQAARIASALSVQNRVQILFLLRDHPLCVMALTKFMGITQGAVSQHLRILKETELVKAERRGQFIHYSLNAETIQQFREVVSELLEPEIEISCKKGEKPCPVQKKNVENVTRKE